MSITKRLITMIMAMACQQMMIGSGEAAASGLRNVERSIVFAVQSEVQASNAGKHVCIGFGNGLAVNQKVIISELKRKSLQVHPGEWCRQGPHRFTIGVLAPVNETSAATYEFVLEVGDVSTLPGEHFATLLRRGTYIVHCDTASGPRLIAYRQTCCPKTN
jgi:hypothetical protein